MRSSATPIEFEVDLRKMSTPSSLEERIAVLRCLPGIGKVGAEKAGGFAHRFFTLLLPLVFIVISTTPAFAAGMDCSRAQSQTEKTICNSDELRERDKHLSDAYDLALITLYAQQRTSLQTAQKQWLKQRDECGADAACIDGRYQSRTEELQRLLVWQPDDVDMAVMEDLRARRGDYSEFEVTAGKSQFDIYGDAPSKTRPDGVTADEWQALRASFDFGNTFENYAITLIDLDGDGQRDLVVEYTVWGTQGASATYAYARRRTGNYFEGDYCASAGDCIDAPYNDSYQNWPVLYVTSEPQNPPEYISDSEWNDIVGRESATLIHLRGRTYAIYKADYGNKKLLYLLKPFTRFDKVPMLMVRYYTLSVPLEQKGKDGKPIRLSDDLYRALTAAVSLAEDKSWRNDHAGQPICPNQKVLNDRDSVSYLDSSDTGGKHSKKQKNLAEVPIQLGDECYIGRVSRLSNGKVQIAMRKPGEHWGDKDKVQRFRLDEHEAKVSTEVQLVAPPR